MLLPFAPFRLIKYFVLMLNVPIFHFKTAYFARQYRLFGNR
ncbi:hypothetical protein HMPREF0653_01821 [Prevotella disiens JCM 6334 = ATCC 29426]|uniref:Uncharacterized protein n=1 Tax=Prevotella disiens JCM 6334 = ATCC 29426 TaxID=1235811 RepID=A0ABP2Y990_9BACT|nr:hypothetical protein HMPREF0653_01821 [Prevotella disiens JCM 6334 = ATCC 29426]